MFKVLLDENLSIIDASKELYQFLGEARTQDLNQFLSDDNKNKFYDVVKDLNKIDYIEFNCLSGIRKTIIKNICLDKLRDGRNAAKIIVVPLEGFFMDNKILEKENKMFKAMVDLVETEFFIYDRKNDNLELFYNVCDYNFRGKKEDLVKNLKNEKYETLERLLSQNNDTIQYEAKGYEIKANTYDDGILGAIIEKNINDLNSRHDFLTGLYNKKTFVDFALKNINNESTLIIVDIDNFKNVNDTYGHKVGDDIIKIVANEIKVCVGSYGIAGRFGGDEIVAFLTTNDELQVRSIVESMRVGVQNKTRNLDNPITISVGISRNPIDATKYEDMFEIADKALYIAKNRGKNRYIIYREEMHKNIVNKRTLSLDNIYIDIYNSCKGCLNKNEMILKTLEIIKDSFRLSQINVYCENKLKYSLGNDVYTDGILEEKYLKFFDERGILIVNNAMPIKAINPIAYSLYQNQGVWSYVQILLKKDNKVIGYFSFEDKVELRSFTNYEVNILYTISNILGNEL